MKEFVEKNKIPITIISFILIIVGTSISVQKVFFPSPSVLKKPVFLPAVEESSFSLETKAFENKNFWTKDFLNKISFLAISLFLFLGGGFLSKRFFARLRRRAQERRNNNKKEDLKDIREALQAFYRLNQRYPDSQDGEFKKIINLIEPPLNNPIANYHYEVLEPEHQQYKAWCYLEKSDGSGQKKCEIQGSK